MNWPMIIAFGGWLICAWAFPLGYYMGKKVGAIQKEVEMKQRLQRVADRFRHGRSTVFVYDDDDSDEVVMN